LDGRRFNTFINGLSSYDFKWRIQTTKSKLTPICRNVNNPEMEPVFAAPDNLKKII
jgi:hypothetical protein